MPTFPFSNVMTANQLGLNPLAGWQYEYLPRPSKVSILIKSTTTGNRVTVYSGSETIQEKTPVQAGGVAGVTPPRSTQCRSDSSPELATGSSSSSMRSRAARPRWTASYRWTRSHDVAPPGRHRGLGGVPRGSVELHPAGATPVDGAL